MKNLTKLALLAIPALISNAAMADDHKPVLTFNEPPECKIHLIEGHSACEESKKVVETMRKIFEAYGKEDLPGIGQYIAEDCTGFGEDHKLIVGRQAVLDHIKCNMDKHQKDSDSPLTSYTIDRPFAQVVGDTATVTFVAYKSYGGKHPRNMISHSTDIFVKKDGKWLASHYVNNWKDTSKIVSVNPENESASNTSH